MQQAGAAPFTTILMMGVCVFLSFAGVHWIMASWFARRIRGWEALSLLGVMLGVLYFSVSLVFNGNPLGMFIPPAALLAGLLARVILELLDRRRYEQFDEEDLHRYRDAIAQDPKNVAAHSLLADLLRRMGRLEEAIAEYQAALDLDGSLKEEKYWLEHCRKELERRAPGAEMTCPRCGAVRRRGEPECYECGRAYSTWETWKFAFLTMAPFQQALCSVILVTAMVVLLAFAALIPGGGMTLIIIGMFASSTFMLIVSYRERRRGRGGPR